MTNYGLSRDGAHRIVSRSSHSVGCNPHWVVRLKPCGKTVLALLLGSRAPTPQRRPVFDQSWPKGLYRTTITALREVAGNRANLRASLQIRTRNMGRNPGGYRLTQVCPSGTPTNGTTWQLGRCGCFWWCR